MLVHVGGYPEDIAYVPPPVYESDEVFDTDNAKVTVNESNTGTTRAQCYIDNCPGVYAEVVRYAQAVNLPVVTWRENSDTEFGFDDWSGNQNIAGTSITGPWISIGANQTTSVTADVNPVSIGSTINFMVHGSNVSVSPTQAQKTPPNTGRSTEDMDTHLIQDIELTATSALGSNPIIEGQFEGNALNDTLRVQVYNQITHDIPVRVVDSADPDGFRHPYEMDDVETLEEGVNALAPAPADLTVVDYPDLLFSDEQVPIFDDPLNIQLLAHYALHAFQSFQPKIPPDLGSRTIGLSPQREEVSIARDWFMTNPSREDLQAIGVVDN